MKIKCVYLPNLFSGVSMNRENIFFCNSSVKSKCIYTENRLPVLWILWITDKNSVIVASVEKNNSISKQNSANIGKRFSILLT